MNDGRPVSQGPTLCRIARGALEFSRFSIEIA
jgi:hypothetical protein